MKIRATVEYEEAVSSLDTFTRLAVDTDTLVRTDLQAEAYYRRLDASSVELDYYPTNIRRINLLPLSETHSLFIRKSVNDTIGFSSRLSFKDVSAVGEWSIHDQSRRGFSKSIRDTLTLSEVLSREGVNTYSESATFTDKISTHLSRSIFDGLSFTEQLKAGNEIFHVTEDSAFMASVAALAVGETLPDNYSMFDIATIAMASRLDDENIVTDTVSTRLNKWVTDTIGISDDSFVSFGGLTTGYVNILAAQTLLSDGLNIDTSILADSPIGFSHELISSLSKPAGENPALSDNAIANLYKNISDSITLSGDLLVRLGSTNIFSGGFGVGDSYNAHLAKPLQDVADLLETSFRSVNQPKADGTDITDAYTNHLSKQLSDLIHLTSSATIVEQDNSFPVSAVGFLELLRTVFDKSLAESAGVIDQYSIGFNKPIADPVSMSDGYTHHLSKNISEVLFLTDPVTYQMYLPKDLSGSAGVTDSSALDVTKPTVDSLALTQLLSVSLTKSAQADLVAITEAAKYLMVKRVADSTLLSEEVIPRVTKIRSDTVTATEALTREFAKNIVDGVHFLENQSIVEHDNSIHTYRIVVSEVISTAVSKLPVSALGLLEDIQVERTKPVSGTTYFTDEYYFAALKRLIDPVVFSDLMQVQLQKAPITDATQILETVSTLLSKAFSDNATVSDTVRLNPNKIRTDGTAIQDGRDLHVGKNLQDTTGFQESLFTEWRRDQSRVSTAVTVDDTVLEVSTQEHGILYFGETVDVDMGSSLFNNSTFNSTTLG